MELEIATKLQADQMSYQTQVEIPVTMADFYFSLEPRPLALFVDGSVHLGKAERVKYEELKCLLRKKGIGFSIYPTRLRQVTLRQKRKRELGELGSSPPPILLSLLSKPRIRGFQRGGSLARREPSSGRH